MPDPLFFPRVGAVPGAQAVARAHTYGRTVRLLEGWVGGFLRASSYHLPTDAQGILLDLESDSGVHLPTGAQGILLDLRGFGL